MDALRLAIATAAEENRLLAAEVESMQLRILDCTTENALISGTLQTYFGWLSFPVDRYPALRAPTDVVVELLHAASKEMSQCLFPLVTGRSSGRSSCRVWSPILAAAVTVIVCYILLRYSATVLALRWELVRAKARVEHSVRESVPQWTLRALAAERMRHRQTQVAALKVLVATAGFLLYMTFVLSATNALSVVLWFFGYEHYEAAPNLWSSILQLPVTLFGQPLLDRGLFHYLLSLIGVPLFTFVTSFLSAAAHDVKFARLVGIEPPPAANPALPVVPAAGRLVGRRRRRQPEPPAQLAA